MAKNTTTHRAWWSFLLIGLFTMGCAAPSAEPAAAPSPAASSAGVESLQAAEVATVERILDALPVRDSERVDGYEREYFGDGWIDTDGNDCRTRDDILQRDLTNVSLDEDNCTVLSGVLEVGPFTGERINFERGASDIDIDHLVALADAWDSGAHAWSEEERVLFANDPRNLLAVSAGENRSKGADSIDQWQPPNTSFMCAYATLIIDTKDAYGLSVTRSEKTALADALSTC